MVICTWGDKDIKGENEQQQRLRQEDLAMTSEAIYIGYTSRHERLLNHHHQQHQTSSFILTGKYTFLLLKVAV